MKIGIMSDSHHDLSAIDDAICLADDVDCWLHAGDSIDDAGYLADVSKKPVYASASSKSSSGTLTGTYYYWNNEVINGRIRVTNAKSRVGVKGQVTGWIQL